MFGKMKLRAKLSGGFIIIFVLMTAIAYVGFNGMKSVRDKVELTNDLNEMQMR